jgi:CRISPR-associated endoribonuclease Cas6
MNYLYAIVLRIAAMHPGAISADHGIPARGAMLKLIEQGDAALSRQWHDANAAKPFTVSLLDGGKRGRDGALHFGEGDTAEWRFTLLRAEAFDAVLNRYIMHNRQPHVRIGALNFAITDAFANSHSESGTITPAALEARWQKATLPAAIRLRFASPTFFNFGKKADGYQYQAMPEPRPLFSTLKKKWDRVAGTHTPDTFDDWVEANVTIVRHDTQIRRVRVNRQRPVQAFTGNVIYALTGEDSTQWSFVNLLADLAFWTGVGNQTTAGLGQVRRLETNWTPS